MLIRFLVTCLVLAVPLVCRAAANLDDVSALEEFFDGAMRVGMEEHHVTGAVVAIVKDGRVLFTK